MTASERLLWSACISITIDVVVRCTNKGVYPEHSQGDQCGDARCSSSNRGERRGRDRIEQRWERVREAKQSAECPPVLSHEVSLAPCYPRGDDTLSSYLNLNVACARDQRSRPREALQGR
jgi:hypothetical protein